MDIPGSIPPDWAQRVAEGHMLFSPTMPSEGWRMPDIGNGYIATVVLSDTQYVAGVYNGQAVRLHHTISHIIQKCSKHCIFTPISVDR